MGRLTLVLGGARSGKSAEALRLAREEPGGEVLYVATAEPGDEEMRQRIQKHRAERPPAWQTLEAPKDLGRLIRSRPGPIQTLVVDCITLLVSNLLIDQPDPYADAARTGVENEIRELIQTAREMPDETLTIVVSNEVGTGLAPVTPLGRAYRDLLGQANQSLAAAADTAILMVAGLPLLLKGGEAQPGEPVLAVANVNLGVENVKRSKEKDG